MRDLLSSSRRALLLVVAILAVFTLAACSDGDSTETADVVEVTSPTSTALPVPTETETQPVPTAIPTFAPPTATAVPEPTVAPTAVPVAAEPEPEPDTAAVDETDSAAAETTTDTSTEAADVAPASDAGTSAGRCLLGSIELPVPGGWSQLGCQSFAAVPDFAASGDCPCQYPIDAATVETETFAEATSRIELSANYAISGSTDRTIGGRPARVYQAGVLVDGTRTTQAIAVVELTDGVLFVAATQDARTAPAELTWDATLAAFNAMIDGAVIDGVRSVPDPAAEVAEPVEAVEPATTDPATDTAATDPATDVAATDPDVTPTPVPVPLGNNDTGCPTLPTVSSAGTPAIIDLNNDGQPEAIVPNQLTGDGLKYDLYSHGGDCNWVSNLQLIDRQSSTPKLTFMCRPDPDGGWLVIEQSRDKNPNGGERVTDQPYRFTGAGVEQLEAFVFQLDDTTLIFQPGNRFGPILDGDRDLCK